jgi:hypothetical protein
MPESNNPLRRFFRQPAVYIKLPSEGNFYPPDAIDIPPNGEFPIYAMTAMDEITYRTSDALFNGTAIINVIKSCVPNILDPWKIPNIDMDTLLVAIRIASYGHAMDFESSCPHCEHENSFGLDLRTILDGMGKADYGSPMQHGDITIFFKPLTYQQVNANSIDQFADQKLLETLPDANVPEEEKMRLLTGAFNKLTDMTMRALTQSISMMQVMEETVVEPEYIEEFIRNCDRDVFNRIRDHIVSLRSTTELKPLKLQCQGCQKDYETPFTMDVSNFFGSAS